MDWTVWFCRWTMVRVPIVLSAPGDPTIITLPYIDTDDPNSPPSSV